MQRAAAAFIAGPGLEQSARAAGWARAFPTGLVMAGHSAGGIFALTTAAYATGSREVRAVVMLDGEGGDMAAEEAPALHAYPGPVWTVAAPPTHPGTATLVQQRPGEFVGVELVNGCHLDATGNRLASLLLTGCWLRTENIAAVQTVASDWIRNALTGTHDGITAGTPGQVVSVGAASAVVLG